MIFYILKIHINLNLTNNNKVINVKKHIIIQIVIFIKLIKWLFK